MIGKIICYFKGYLRGKNISKVNGISTLQCPRCKATWTRRIRVVK